MYFQPYGDEQQLNLNWIINEIINLHKQLDPDYETPSFTQVYPYSNLNRLNLDWILSELKALKELAPEPTPTIDIQAVAEALVALPFDSNTSYQIYDFISKDGEIWRATEAIPAGGVWDSSKWFKTKIGTDLAVLDRWINTINNSLTAEIQARQDADTTLQTNINNEALARQQADTELQTNIDNEALARQQADTALQNAINSEATARQQADTAINGSLNTIENSIAFVIEGNRLRGSSAVPEGQYVLLLNSAISGKSEGLYIASKTIPANTDIDGTYFTTSTPLDGGGLNNPKKWELFGTYTGVHNSNLMPADVTFPTDTEEVCIVSKLLGVSLILAMADLKRSGGEYRQTGYYVDTTYNGGFATQIRATTSTFGYCRVTQNGADATSDFEIFIKR